MKKGFFILICMIPLWVYAQSPKISTDKKTNWSKFKTFDIDNGELVTVLKTEVDRDQVLKDVRNTIIQLMEMKGYKHTPDSADLYVTFTAEAIETTNVENVGPLGQEPADQPIDAAQSRVWTQDRKQGSLAIGITERGSSKSLWRSSMTVDFGGNDLTVSLNGAAGRCIRKLPATKKK